MNALEQATPDGYKQTEVGVIPEDWKVSKLGNIGKFKNGINKDADSFGYGLPFINLMDVFGKSYISGKEKLGLINSTEFERKEYNVKESDVLFIRSSVKPSGVGLTSVALQDLNDAVYSGFLIRYRSNEDLTKDFKKHCFYDNGFRNRLIAASTVSANTNINQDALKDLQVAYPSSTKEQTAIANALSDVDALLTELEKLIAKKQAIKTATMQQLLTGKIRLPQFATYTEGEKKDQRKGTKPSELGEIPQDWDVVSLGDVITFKNGAAHEDCIDEYGNFVLVNSKFISTEGKVRKGTNECRQATIKNDLLMVMSDVPNGKAIAKCFLVDQDNLYTVNQRICILRPNEQINPTFLLKIVSRNPYYLAFDDGAKQTNLRRVDVLNCPIVNPSFEEQTAIATILSDMDNEIQTLEQRLAKTRQIKQGMMQELLTGRTRLPFDNE